MKIIINQSQSLSDFHWMFRNYELQKWSTPLVWDFLWDQTNNSSILLVFIERAQIILWEELVYENVFQN